MIKYLCFIDNYKIDELENAMMCFQRQENYKSEIDFYTRINADRGYSDNLKHAERCKNDSLEHVIFTNQIALLSHEFGWRNDLEEPERIYIYKAGKLIHVRELTNKEIRESHNIMQMYMNGAFELLEDEE